MKQHTITLLFVLLSIFIFVATLLTLPRIDGAQPDPYFHIKVTPITYWIGFFFSIFLTLGIVFLNKKGNTLHYLGLFSVMLLAVYAYDIPKLFYVNPNYTDTYIFIGELLYTLRYGHVGWGHSYETPGLALFSSQFSLITGIDHIIIADIVLLAIPLVTTLFIYAIARLLAGKRVALLACLFSVSANWMGFAFNRQSFGLMLFALVCYSMFKLFVSKTKNRYWYIVIVSSFIALVVSHPVSSLFVILTAFSIAFFSFLISSIRRRLHSQEHFFRWRRLAKKAMALAAVFSFIWLLWNIPVGVNLDYAFRTFDNAYRGIFGLPRDQPIGSFIPSYTNAYLPVVDLRLMAVGLEFIIGVILSFLVLFKMRHYPKKFLVSSWFIGCIFISVFAFLGSWLQLLYRPFHHAFPAFSILLAWFIVRKSKNKPKLAPKIIKALAVGLMMSSLIVLPLVMYSHAPFMYPPQVYLDEISYVIQYGNGTIAVLEVGSEYGYYQLLKNAPYTDVESYTLSDHSMYETIMTSYNGYTKDAFFVYSPSLTQTMDNLTTIFSKCPAFARVYVADSWHMVYVNQSISSAAP